MVNLPRHVWTQHGGNSSAAGSRNTGAVWDPANCLIEPGETPAAGAVMLGSAVSHVHIKDLRRTKDGWEHVLTGEANTRAVEIIS
jgi:sugar phosphate isomerase/epimerase